MPQAIVNPDEVLKFAKKLNHFSKDTQGRASDVNTSLRSLGSTWRDREYQKLATDLDEAMRVIKRIAERAEQYHAYLTRKARKAQEYLDQR